MNNMKVQKRNGEFEEVSFDKILNRIKLLCIGEEFKYKLFTNLMEFYSD